MCSGMVKKEGNRLEVPMKIIRKVLCALAAALRAVNDAPKALADIEHEETQKLKALRGE